MYYMLVFFFSQKRLKAQIFYKILYKLKIYIQILEGVEVFFLLHSSTHNVSKVCYRLWASVSIYQTCLNQGGCISCDPGSRRCRLEDVSTHDLRCKSLPSRRKCRRGHVERPSFGQRELETHIPHVGWPTFVGRNFSRTRNHFVHSAWPRQTCRKNSQTRRTRCGHTIFHMTHDDT